MISLNNLPESVLVIILFLAIILYYTFLISFLQNFPALLTSIIDSLCVGWSWVVARTHLNFNLNIMSDSNKKRKKKSRTDEFADSTKKILERVHEKHNFASLVRMLDPTLEGGDPGKWRMIMEIMAAVHFCFMMLNTLTNTNSFYKESILPHSPIFGPAETANRAYWTLSRVLNKTLKHYPRLMPFLVQNLEEIFEGQDISLVWRRDGIKALPDTKNERLRAYRRYADLKTGAVFRLVGQLVTEGNGCDDLMSSMAWHNHLQTDCHPLFLFPFHAPVDARRVFTDALRNNAFSWPTILALNHTREGDIVAQALKTKNPRDIERAIGVIQCQLVHETCQKELEMVDRTVRHLKEVWRRRNGNGKG